MKSHHGKVTGLSALGIVAMALVCGCGGAPPDGGSAGGSAAADSPAAAFEGDFQATWTATANITSPAGVGPQSGTLTGVIHVTAQDNDNILMAWQVEGNTPSGTITFAVSGDTATATGMATGGSCWTGVLPNGNTQTSCATSASAVIQGDMLIQHQSGTLTGTTPDNVAYSGTYDGMWTGTRTK